MKIAHISQTDGGAGAGRAAYRIHRSLLALGAESSMFVSEKRTLDETVFAVGKNKLWVKLQEYLEAKLAKYDTAENAGHFSPARFGHFDPAGDARIRTADIVSLYWINGGYILPERLAGLKQPIVWRLSDVWPFTGGCHYPGGCEGFAKHCGDCPQLARPLPYDNSRRLFERKMRAWRDVDITIAAPSQWIAGLARKSALFAGRRIEVIPTGIDTDSYRPLGRAAARAKFAIPQDKTVILFGAMDGSDPRKGFAQLHGALGQLSQSKFAPQLLAVVFGNPPANLALPIPAMFLGRLDDDASLATAYSAADMVVVPSLEENLPNVALEAIACGAPVVGFDVCGMADIVRHGWNGYLARAGDVAGLAEGMGWVASQTAQPLAENARKWALENFSAKRQAESYLSLYQELLAHDA